MFILLNTLKSIKQWYVIISIHFVLHCYRYSQTLCVVLLTSKLCQGGRGSKDPFRTVGSMNGSLLVLPILEQLIELLNVLQHHLCLLLLIWVIIFKWSCSDRTRGTVSLLSLTLILFLSSCICVNIIEILMKVMHRQAD